MTPGSKMLGATLACLGGDIRLDDGPMVLFTYGKDGTPTCTNEVLDFDAHLPQFETLGYRVIGLSKDKLAAHERFAAKHGLKVRLASDHGGTVMEEIGAFGEKLFFGKMVTGVLRTTYVISATGMVDAVFKVEKVAGHAAEVLGSVQK